VASKSNREHVVSFLATRSHSNLALVLGLSSILIVMAAGFGHLLVRFYKIATAAENETSVTSSRSLLLLSAYQQALDAYNLAEQAIEKQATRTSLQPLYEEKIDSFSRTRNKYFEVHQIPSADSRELEASARNFFVLIDSLLWKTNLVYSASVLPSGKFNVPAEARHLVERGIMNYFIRLRQSRDALLQLEMEESSKQIRRASDTTRVAAELWFFVSGIMFFFASGLVVVVIVLTGRAAALMQQVKAVVAQSTNPILILDSSGKVLYVNSEFEKWTGISGESIVGRNGLEAIHLHDSPVGDDLAWTMLLQTLSKGESWSGEADVHHRASGESLTTLVAFPVFDQHGKLQEAVCIFHDTTEKRQLTRKLLESREQYQSLIESSRDGIVVVQDDILVFVNPAAVRIFQYDSQEDMKHVKFIDTVAPPSRPFLKLDYLHRLGGEDIMKNYEMKGLTKNRKLIDLELDARAIVWNDREALHVSFRDISERKTMERQQAVWLWEQETLSSIDRQLLGIVDMQKVLDIILQQVMLLTRCEFVGIAVIDIDNRQGHWRAARGNRASLVGDEIDATSEMVSALQSREYLIVEDYRSGNHFTGAELRVLKEENIISVGFFPLIVNTELRGRLVVGYHQPHKFVDREIRVLLAMAEKLSIALSSGELYENLVKREKELELLSGARVQAQEEERRRIAREIHDGLGQLLTAIKLNLEILEDSLPIQEDAGKRIGEMKQLLDSVLKDAREISYNLMPSVLDDFGLGPGLQSLCEQFSKRTGLKVSFHEHGLEERMAPDVEIGLYRIVQEALNNVAKHAEAKEVEVQLVRHANRLRMTIEDDGKGMDAGLPARKPSGSGGTGLVSMRERATSFSGSFLIDSTPGNGTLINVEIPMKGS
jgi:PAS domain S-box-containing protein